MKRILMITTGGTIASVATSDGFTPGIDGTSLLKMVPVLTGKCDITCSEIFNIDSSNITPRHWQMIAKTIDEVYFDYDGFVISHGTDTMAYTAAALSWMLKNPAKPIVLTGAQVPITLEGTDAKDNLINAFEVACSGVEGVCIVFGNQVISGLHAKKLCSEDFNGFSSINAKPWATIDETGIHWQKSILDRMQTKDESVRMGFRVMPNLEEKVVVLKVIPGMKPDVLEYYYNKGFKGIVIESFGAGGVPNEDNNWLPALEWAINSGMTVVCSTQCIYDGVNLRKYPIGVLAERLGAKSAGLQTIEATVTKLMWDLAN